MPVCSKGVNRSCDSKGKRHVILAVMTAKHAGRKISQYSILSYIKTHLRAL